MTFMQVPLERRVEGEGPKDAKIAIVGEAPGTEEDRAGRPFVGRAGTVLDQCLHSAGLTRSDVYITNLVKTKPPKNNITPWVGKGGLTEKGKDAANELYKELREVGANVIITLGNSPTLALTGESGVTKLRGSVLSALHECGLDQKIIPAIHPAAALRGQYLYRYYIVADLKKAKRHSTSRQFPDQARLEVDMTFGEARAWFDYFRTRSDFSVDIEVVNHELACISFCQENDLSVSIPFFNSSENREGENNWSLEEEMVLYQELETVLARTDVVKIFQNGGFDMTFLAMRNGIITAKPYDDTMIMQSLMYPDFPKGLDFITSMYTDIPYYKDEGKDWRAPKSHRKFRMYNANDGLSTFQSWKILQHDIDADGFREIYDFTMRLLEPLMYMMVRGMRTSHEELIKAKELATTQIAEKLKRLTELCGRPLNPNSPKDCQAYFYIEKGIPPYTKSSKDSSGQYKSRITTDDKAMQRLAKGTSQRAGLPEARLVQEVRALKKIKGTYLDISFDEDQRMRCSYNPRGTKFGRLSSSKNVFGNGTNMQNLPYTFKKFLIADPGCLLVELDKARAEWVVVAFLSGDANMIKVCMEGLDPHTYTGHLMTGVPMELIVVENDLIGHLSDPREIEAIRESKLTKESRDLLDAARFVPRSMSIRQCGKKANHGLNYDEGYKTFALMNEMGEGESKIIVRDYKTVVYPGVKRWHQFTQEQLSRERVLYNCFGRKQRFLDGWSEQLFKAAYSFIPQSTVSDLLNWGIIKTYEDQHPCMKGVEILAQVHDSILLQIPVGDWRKMADAVHRVKQHLDPDMEYHGRKFHIDTDMKIGLSWGAMEEVKFGDVPIELSTNTPLTHETAQNLERVYNEIKN